MLPFRAQLHIFVAVAAACLAHPAGAQTYPTQNITLQVAFAAGGIADVVARLVGQKLSERFGQTVVVENRGGAGGNLAAKAVSGAAPDGYTIPATTTSLAVNENRHEKQGLLGRRFARHPDRGLQSRRSRRASEQSGERLERVHREREEQELHLWQCRRRHGPAHRRGIFFQIGRAHV